MTIIRGKFTVLNMYKNNRMNINELNSQLKQLGKIKTQQTEPRNHKEGDNKDKNINRWNMT